MFRGGPAAKLPLLKQIRSDPHEVSHGNNIGKLNKVTQNTKSRITKTNVNLVSRVRTHPHLGQVWNRKKMLVLRKTTDPSRQIGVLSPPWGTSQGNPARPLLMAKISKHLEVFLVKSLIGFFNSFVKNCIWLLSDTPTPWAKRKTCDKQVTKPAASALRALREDLHARV